MLETQPGEGKVNGEYDVEKNSLGDHGMQAAEMKMSRIVIL